HLLRPVSFPTRRSSDLACHGANRRGRDRAPSLIGLVERLSKDEVRRTIDWGRGFMPSFASLPAVEKRALVQYLGYELAASDTGRSEEHTSELQSRAALG